MKTKTAKPKDPLARAKRLAKVALKRKAEDKQETGMKIILSLSSAIFIIEKMGHKATRFPDFPEQKQEWLSQLETINRGIREWMNKTQDEE